MIYNCKRSESTVAHWGSQINEKGVPIRKPWTIATNDEYVFRKFQNKVCPGKEEHPEHCPTAGKYTKMTENYTDQMVKLIHKAWKCSVLRRIKHALSAWETVPAMPVTQNFYPKSQT